MRLGVDLGGTKTEIIALDDSGRELLRRRVATARSYEGTLAVITELVREAETELGAKGSVGLAIPGTISRLTGLAKNANSIWLNGKPFARDLEARLERPIRTANDANCFALSEAADGAAKGAHVVFGVILGTGTGGGVVVGGQVLDGAHGIAGEWGHNPLPGMTREEWDEAGPCYCGGKGCIEQWLSGAGLTADFLRHPLRPSHAQERATALGSLGREPRPTTSASRAGEADQNWTPQKIAASDQPQAKAAMGRWMERMGRALASVMNILDPDAVVLGGGLSNIEALYRDLPAMVERHGFCPETPPRILRNVHGDSSGVRGAAWLWPVGQ
ncbi:MAG TPA: ROK family protein [Rhizomicrobium sp.]|nr:ROK family protein [Rhizomicrobium sp.]